MEPGRLELYPYHALMETSEETDAGPSLVLSRKQMLLYMTPTQRSKVSWIFAGVTL